MQSSRASAAVRGREVAQGDVGYRGLGRGGVAMLRARSFQGVYESSLFASVCGTGLSRVDGGTHRVPARHTSGRGRQLPAINPTIARPGSPMMGLG
jgi:hypothetical protein